MEESLKHKNIKTLKREDIDNAESMENSEDASLASSTNEVDGGQTKNKKNKKRKRGLIVIGVVLVLAVGSIIEYNYYKNKVINQKKQEQISRLTNFIITHKVIQQDFVNRDKKLKADAIPPVSYQKRFMSYINISLEAIKVGVPSQPKFKDLQDDYLNVASSYSILGDYKNSEKYYIKLLSKWPKNYKANMNLGDLYILMNQYRSAANKFLDDINFYPSDFRVPDKFADLYIKYSISPDKLDKVDNIYRYGIKNANNPKTLYKNYIFFLENYLKDYKRALKMEKEYQKITGSKSRQEVEKLEKMIK